MTPREQAAFAAGIEIARQMALTAAITIEVRDDAGDLRQRAAVAALQGLAAGLKETFLAPVPHTEPASALQNAGEGPNYERGALG
jgi:hypothetical protein